MRGLVLDQDVLGGEAAGEVTAFQEPLELPDDRLTDACYLGKG